MNDRDMVAAKNLVAVICRDGGHHAEAVGVAKACKDAQEHIVRLLDIVTNVIEVGDIVCDQMGAEKSERAGNEKYAEVRLLKELRALREELAVVEGWERVEEL